MLDFSNINALWGSLVIEESIRNGCDYFCVSPGSRSTPLTVAVARNPQAKQIICYDERGAAFHALGYARATGRAAVLICSSGTAAANYLPAVIEASVDRLPMLVLSADRPPELRDTMANQTITQPGMLSPYVRWFFDMPVPTEAIAPQMPLTTVDQALYRAHGERGPVHLNFMFRKPLEPVVMDGGISAEYVQKLDRYQALGTAQTAYQLPIKTLDGSRIPRLRQHRKGLLIVGQLQSEKEEAAVRQFASQLGWPVLPDVTSRLRLSNSVPNLIHYFDQILLQDDPALYPDVVVQLGGQFVSKRLLEFLGRCRPELYIVVNDAPTRFDPDHTVTHRVEASLGKYLPTVLPVLLHFAAPLAEGLELAQRKAMADDWVRQWVRRNGVVRKVLQETFAFDEGQGPIVNEGIVARGISAEIPSTHALFVGNSMPIRDVDMYAVDDGNWVPVAANRGASGIDGNVATAIGYAVGLARPTTLLLGDLTLLHDLNSLSLLRHSSQPLTIVVINNGGGGIFHMLPIRNFDDVFEENFGTPHHFGFADAAKMFGIVYSQPDTIGTFIEAYRNAVSGTQHTLIEVRTNREANWQAHTQLANKIRTALTPTPP